MPQSAVAYGQASQSVPVTDSVTSRAARSANAASRLSALAERIKDRIAPSDLPMKNVAIANASAPSPDHVVFSLTTIEGELQAAENTLIEIERLLG